MRDSDRSVRRDFYFRRFIHHAIDCPFSAWIPHTKFNLMMLQLGGGSQVSSSDQRFSSFASVQVFISVLLSDLLCFWSSSAVLDHLSFPSSCKPNEAHLWFYSRIPLALSIMTFKTS